MTGATFALVALGALAWAMSDKSSQGYRLALIILWPFMAVGCVLVQVTP